MKFWEFDVLKCIELGWLLFEVTSDTKRNEILKIGYLIILLYYMIWVICDQRRELWNFLEFSLPDTKYCDLYKYV